MAKLIKLRASILMICIQDHIVWNRAPSPPMTKWYPNNKANFIWKQCNQKECSKQVQMILKTVKPKSQEFHN